MNAQCMIHDSNAKSSSGSNRDAIFNFDQRNGPFQRSQNNFGFNGGSVVKNLSDKQETQVSSRDWEDTLEKEMATHASILAGKSHGQKSLEGYSAWVLKRVGHNLVTKQQQQNNSELARKANLRMKQG